MRALVNLLDRFLKSALAGLMALLVLCVAWQVLSRYALHSPSSWTEECARFLLIWIGVLGASYAYRTRMHLGLDLLSRKVSPTGRRYLEMFIQAVAIIFVSVVMVLGGGNLVAMTWELQQFSAALELPIALIYSVIPLSGLIIVVYALDDFLKALIDLRRLQDTEHS